MPNTTQVYENLRDLTCLHDNIWLLLTDGTVLTQQERKIIVDRLITVTQAKIALCTLLTRLLQQH